MHCASSADNSEACLKTTLELPGKVFHGPKIQIYNSTIVILYFNALQMYALSPSIFELLHTSLKVVHSHLAALIPSLQYAVLNVLYSHCQRLV